MGLLEGKTVMITGASRGIGRAIAYKFADEGANIALTNITEDVEFCEVCDECEKRGATVKRYVSNVADHQDSQRVANEVLKDFGSIDILVNNAGITRDTLLMRMTEEQWDLVLQVNLKGVFNLTKAVISTMMKKRSGSILLIHSKPGTIPTPIMRIPPGRLR